MGGAVGGREGEWGGGGEKVGGGVGWWVGEAGTGKERRERWGRRQREGEGVCVCECVRVCVRVCESSTVKHTRETLAPWPLHGVCVCV